MQNWPMHNVSPAITVLRFRALLPLLALFAGACESMSITPPPIAITLEGPIAFGLYPGEWLPIAAQVTDNLGRTITDVQVDWTVADTNIARISHQSSTSTELVARNTGRTSLTLTVIDSRFVASRWVSLVTVQ